MLYRWHRCCRRKPISFCCCIFYQCKTAQTFLLCQRKYFPYSAVPLSPSPFDGCCQLLLFCLLSICNKCICDVKDACDMRYSTTATKRRTHLSQGATACSSSSSCCCCCCREKETLATHIFVLVLALFAVVVAFVVVRCAVVRLICDTFRIILVAASTKVCLLFRYVSSLPPSLCPSTSASALEVVATVSLSTGFPVTYTQTPTHTACAYT